MNVNISIDTKVVAGITSFRSRVTAADFSLPLTLEGAHSLVNFGWSENEDVVKHAAHEWAKNNNHTAVLQET